MVTQKERIIIEDELKAWKKGLKFYEKLEQQDRIQYCKGGIKAIQGLQKGLGLYVVEETN